MPAPYHRREPFSFETFVHVFDRVFLSPALNILALLLTSELGQAKLAQYFSNLNFPLNLLRQARPWIVRIAKLAALRHVSGALNRWAMNNGWRADRPRWWEEVVVITGGSAGIGEQVVRILAEYKVGVKIAILDRAAPKEHVLSANVRFYQVDITDADKVSQVAAQIRTELGSPTILINNAGIMRSKALLELTPKEFEHTLKVNVCGAFHIVREFLPAIVAKNHGHIVNVSSTAAYVSPPNLGDYSASKAGILAFHEALSNELTSRYNAPKVRTTVICPLKVRTALGMGAADHRNPFISPVQERWQVAQRIVASLDSGLSHHHFLPSHMGWMLPQLRCYPAWYSRFIMATSGTNQFATKETAARAAAAGYRPE